MDVEWEIELSEILWDLLGFNGVGVKDTLGISFHQSGSWL
jgi:hypothetical protein